MRWVEVHVKLCLILKVNLGAEMTVGGGGIYKLNLQVLHWATPQGKVPLSGDDSWCRLL